ncbi:MAG: ribonuclease III [Alphaproteobacteria bacterium]|nr:ribonuclease III [Alphaproteobacteria bacterium]
MTDSLEQLGDLLGHRFVNAALLEEALTHSSVHSMSNHKNYERLEFLGDRVLGLIIARLLYDRFPHEKEGVLALRFSNLVRRETLIKISQKLGLERYLILARGERMSGGQNKPSVLADSCEALIAALYLDGGLTKAQHFVETYWAEEFESSDPSLKVPKSIRQEWAQAQGLPAPTYKVITVEGEDHLPLFTIEVQVQGYPGLRVQGASKREAMQKAADLFLKELNKHESIRS